MRAACIQEGIKQEKDRLVELVRLRQPGVIFETWQEGSLLGVLGSARGRELIDRNCVSPLLSEDGEQPLVLTEGLLNLLHKWKEGKRCDVLRWARMKWFFSEILWHLVLQLEGNGACGAVLLTEVSAGHCPSAVPYWRWRRSSLQWVHFQPVWKLNRLLK